MFTYAVCKALTFVKGDNFGTVSKIGKFVKLINFKLIFLAFRTKMCIKVKCFTKIEIKSLITNHKKRGPETVFFVPTRETTYVGSEKMGTCGKTFNFICDFIAFSNINLQKWVFSFKGCFILVFNLQWRFPQLYLFWASKGDKHAYDPHCFRNWWTDDKGPSKLNVPLKIIENRLFLLLMVYVNAKKQK